jgi:hypothetical protein
LQVNLRVWHNPGPGLSECPDIIETRSLTVMLESLRMEGCEMLGFMNDWSKNRAAIASMRRVTWSHKIRNENYEHFIHLDHCREDQFTSSLVRP